VPPPAVALHPLDPPLQAGDLLVVLRVESDHKQHQQPVKQYPIGIPTLEPMAGAYGVTGASFATTHKSEAGCLTPQTSQGGFYCKLHLFQAWCCVASPHKASPLQVYWADRGE
jgi:hypothetical protein